MIEVCNNDLGNALNLFAIEKVGEKIMYTCLLMVLSNATIDCERRAYKGLKIVIFIYY